MSQVDAELKAALLLPLVERIEHHLWKVRADSFDELLKDYKAQTSGKAPIFNETGTFCTVTAGPLFTISQRMCTRGSCKTKSYCPKKRGWLHCWYFWTVMHLLTSTWYYLPVDTSRMIPDLVADVVESLGGRPQTHQLCVEILIKMAEIDTLEPVIVCHFLSCSLLCLILSARSPSRCHQQSSQDCSCFNRCYPPVPAVRPFLCLCLCPAPLEILCSLLSPYWLCF